MKARKTGKLPMPMQIEMVAVEKLNPAPYNPRHWSPKHLKAAERSLREFGLVDPLIVRREDDLVIGGHLRLHVLLDMQKRDDAKTADGKELLSDGLVPVVYLDGLSDSKTKLLNLALNKVQGDWDFGSLAAMLDGLRDEDLTVAGFEDKEVADYLALLQSQEELAAAFPDEDPDFSTPTRVAFEFSLKEVGEAVKEFVDKQTPKGAVGGDVLARLLGVADTL